MSDKAREAFEAAIAHKNLSLDKFVSGRYEDENVQSAWWGYKAATEAARAEYLPVVELIDEVNKVCVMSLLDQDCLQHNMRLLYPRIREVLAAPLLGGK